MFSAGLFANIIPLLILAITSVVGLTSYHFVQLQSKGIPNDLISEKTNINSDEIVWADENVDYNTYSFLDFYNVFDNQHSNLESNFILRIVSYTPGNFFKLLSHCFLSSNYNRPPPFFGLKNS